MKEKYLFHVSKWEENLIVVTINPLSHWENTKDLADDFTLVQLDDLKVIKSKYNLKEITFTQFEYCDTALNLEELRVALKAEGLIEDIEFNNHIEGIMNQEEPNFEKEKKEPIQLPNDKPDRKVFIRYQDSLIYLCLAKDVTDVATVPIPPSPQNPVPTFTYSFKIKNEVVDGVFLVVNKTKKTENYVVLPLPKMGADGKPEAFDYDAFLETYMKVRMANLSTKIVNRLELYFAEKEDYDKAIVLRDEGFKRMKSNKEEVVED